MRSVDRPPAARTDRIHIRDAGDERIHEPPASVQSVPVWQIRSPSRCHTCLRDAASRPFDQRDETGAPAFRVLGLRNRSQGPRTDRIRLPVRRVGTPAALRVPAPGRVARTRWRFGRQHALGTGLTPLSLDRRKDHEVPRIRAIPAARRAGRCGGWADYGIRPIRIPVRKYQVKG